VYSRIKRQAQEHACVGYFFAVREGSSPAMRAAVMAGRVFANARMRGMLCGAGLGILGSQCASVAKSTVIHAPRFPTAGATEAASKSHRAAMRDQPPP
jgi:hypothetical protein